MDTRLRWLQRRIAEIPLPSEVGEYINAHIKLSIKVDQKSPLYTLLVSLDFFFGFDLKNKTR